MITESISGVHFIRQKESSDSWADDQIIWFKKFDQIPGYKTLKPAVCTEYNQEWWEIFFFSFVQ